jgi:hypothetical protein
MKMHRLGLPAWAMLFIFGSDSRVQRLVALGASGTLNELSMEPAMLLPRFLLSLAGAFVGLALAATVAQAAPAFASTSVNVRSGAGTGYAVVDVLRPGQRVDVEYCRGTWCYVTKSGPNGWVSASYLSAERYGGSRYRDDDYFYIERPRYRYRPYYPRYRSQFCWGGQNASFCFRD